jgi:hypothetical protein
MRTLRLSLAGTVVLALLGGLGGVVLAQDEADEVTPVVVTGDESCTHVVEGTESIGPGGVMQTRGVLLDCTNSMSDPRVSGTFRNTWNADYYPAADEVVVWGTHVLDDPVAGWECSYTGMNHPSEDIWVLLHAVCQGTGEYEGLTYAFYHVEGESDIGNGTSYHGFIYEGPPPPWGPIPAPSSE